MRSIIIPALAALALGVAGLSGGAQAAAAGPTGIEKPADGIGEVRMTRREMRQRRMMRSRMMRSRTGRSAAPSQAGNARDPSRPMMQQNQGTTTGGPRY